MAVLTQLTTAAIAMMVGFTVFRDGHGVSLKFWQATLSLILIIIVFNRFLPFVFFSRTKGQWMGRLVLPLKILIYITLPVTLALGFLQSVTSLTRETSGEQPESQAEAVDALIERARKRAFWMRAIAT